MGLFGASSTRMCLQCHGLGRLIVHATKTYRETSHCYACDGAGRVRVMPDGRPEPSFGWGRSTSQAPPGHGESAKVA
jgi:hypothetical protein